MTLPLGFLIEQFVNKRPITTRVRLGLLKSRLDGVFKGAEVARKSLEDATSEIELIEREVARKFEALNTQRSENEALTSELNGDPKAVARYLALTRQAKRKSARQQWIGVVVGVIAGGVISYVVNFTTGDVLEILRGLFR